MEIRGCIIIALLATLVTGVFTSKASACESLRPIDQASAQKLMDVLTQSDGKPMDQVFAFETLACASQPVLRRFALEQGLASKQSILRSQALAEILFQRDSILIEISKPEDGSDREDLGFFTSLNGFITLKFQAKSRINNCISTFNTKPCDGTDGYYVVIDGLNVRMRMNHNGATGNFRLQPDNSLRGTIRRWGIGRGMAAKIELL